MAKNLDDTLNDPAFKILPFEDKRQVLAYEDQEFKDLTDIEQRQAMNAMGAGVLPEENPLTDGLKGTLSRVARPTLEMAGGIIGGAAGLGVAPLAGPAAPAMPFVGGALGLAGGKAAADALDVGLGLKKPPKNIKEAAIETLDDIDHGVKSEVLGSTVGKGLSIAAREGGQLGSDLFERAKAAGVELTPGEALNSRAFSLLEKGFENTPTSAWVMQRFRNKQMEGLLKMREDLLKKGGPPEQIESLGLKIQQKVDDILQKQLKARAEELPALRDKALKMMGSNESFEALGQNTKEAMKTYSQTRNEEAKKMFDELDKLIPQDSYVKAKNLRETAKAILKEQKDGLLSMRDPKVMKTLNELAQPLDTGERGLILPGGKGVSDRVEITWSKAKRARSDLSEAIRSTDEAARTGNYGMKFQSTPEAGVYKRLRKALDMDIESFSNESGGAIKETYDTARAFYGENKKSFGDPNFRKILNANPDRVIGVAFRPNGVTEIRTLRKSIPPEQFDRLKQKFTSVKILGEGKEFTGDTIRKNMERYGEEMLANVYSPSEMKVLSSLSDQAKALDKDIVADPLFKKILHAEPEKVVDRIVQPNNTRNLAVVQAVLGDEGTNLVKQGMVTKLLGMNKQGHFSPKLMNETMNKYGDTTLSEVFSKEELAGFKKLREFGVAAGRAEDLAGNPSGTARNVMISGAIQGAGFWIKHPRTVAMVLAAPPVMAKMWLNPTVREYLIKGLTLPPGSRESAEVATKLMTMAILNGGKKVKREE